MTNQERVEVTWDTHVTETHRIILERQDYTDEEWAVITGGGTENREEFFEPLLSDWEGDETLGSVAVTEREATYVVPVED